MTTRCIAGDGRPAVVEVGFHVDRTGEPAWSYPVCRVHDAVIRGMLDALVRNAEEVWA